MVSPDCALNERLSILQSQSRSPTFGRQRLFVRTQGKNYSTLYQGLRDSSERDAPGSKKPSIHEFAKSTNAFAPHSVLGAPSITSHIFFAIVYFPSSFTACSTRARRTLQVESVYPLISRQMRDWKVAFSRCFFAFVRVTLSLRCGSVILLWFGTWA